MSKVMAECHWAQRRILEEAMTLQPRKQPLISSPFPHRPARLASCFKMKLKNWRARFHSWIASQRSYVQVLTGWLLSCVRFDATDDASPGQSCDETHPVIGLCVEWSRQLDVIHEASVVEGIEYFTASMRDLWVKEEGRGESVVAETMVEDEIMIICNGMAVAMSSLAKFAMATLLLFPFRRQCHFFGFFGSLEIELRKKTNLTNSMADIACAYFPSQGTFFLTLVVLLLQ